jgi:hypothetical protein
LRWRRFELAKSLWRIKLRIAKVGCCVDGEKDIYRETYLFFIPCFSSGNI